MANFQGYLEAYKPFSSFFFFFFLKDLRFKNVALLDMFFIKDPDVSAEFFERVVCSISTELYGVKESSGWLDCKDAALSARSR